MNSAAVYTGRKRSVGLSASDRAFHAICNTWLILSGLLVLYPLIYVVACSFSGTTAILTGKVFLWPVDFSLLSYRTVLEHPWLVSGFFNSILYAVGACVVGVGLILLASYPLSRKDFPDRRLIQTFFVITMFFGGGLIPSYILMKNLGLVGSRWALIAGAGFNCYGMVVIKTYFQNSLPDGLLDAAHIDGCGDLQFFFRFVLPLSVPVIAVQVLFSVVGTWNSYFSGMLYLTDPTTYNFQQVLREIFFVSNLTPEQRAALDPVELAKRAELAYQLRYSVIVIGAFPMMVLYPFIQKYFIKGMMLGSLKE
jgi:multiple sugar transport system permease protein/putative aldouronate transport system permease protein